MTGTVEWSTLLWIVGLITGVAVGTFLIMWRVLGWVNTELHKRDIQIAAVDARAKAEESVIAKSLADHKLHAAEVFATKSGLTEALNRVHDALDNLSQRIDALIAANTRGPSGGAK